MAVTELALLRLRSSSSKPLSPSSSSSLVTNLLKAKEAQESYSHHAVHFFSQIEDPSYLYLLGGWDSVATHLDDWIPSATNQGLLELLKEEIEVLWMFHVEIDPQQGNNSDSKKMILDETVTVARYFVKKGGKEAFQEAFDAVSRHHLADSSANPRPFLRGGWRIDKDKEKNGDEEEKEEFVLFTGWDDVADHMGFAESEEDFMKEELPNNLRDLSDAVEVKHAVKLTL
ncbi:hypothetical protein VTN77DRAFT_9506 [Rasamsonia byssochlamydoides]|uniref:uncharacterized protein n=1 Tax=Rasamsonia byssochlamydoides TaxID=89139 RepID=UPI003742B672